MKGMIALDIDGTITAHPEQLPENVVRYLTELWKEGWQLFFVTGRPFRWAHRTLSPLSFPYYFAVQNGAIVLEMPSSKILAKNYLPASVLPAMAAICQGEPSDFVIYSGCENRDLCYYRPDYFSSALLGYVHNRVRSLREEWIPLDSFDQLSLDGFPSLKCFGTQAEMAHVQDKIEVQLYLHAPLIKDPFDPSFYVLQATAPGADKGQALRQLVSLTGRSEIVIAAGDDQNDRALFDVADIKIAMVTAPPDLLARADIIAPAAAEEGIIQGLQEAIHRIKV